ncbi:MAG: hypothetical protein U0X76_11030 [Bacteroidia bacterium]
MCIHSRIYIYSGAGNQTVTYDTDVIKVSYGLPIIMPSPTTAEPLLQRTKTLGGTTVVNKDLNITGVGSTPTVTLQLSTATFTVTQSTNINAYGTCSTITVLPEQIHLPVPLQ